MSSKSEFAINNTSIWLSESPIQHERINSNSFRILDSTDGVPQYEIELSISDTHVGYASKVLDDQRSCEGYVGFRRSLIQYNYQFTGPSLSKAEDGSIVATTDYYVEEHTPHKMFSTLASFEPIQREVGPDLIEIAARTSLVFK